MAILYIFERVIALSTYEILQEQIIQKAWEDSEFKKQLIEHPKAALKEAFGIEIPDSIELEALEETAGHYYFVIPQNPKSAQTITTAEGAAWQ